MRLGSPGFEFPAVAPVAVGRCTTDESPAPRETFPPSSCDRADGKREAAARETGAPPACGRVAALAVALPVGVLPVVAGRDGGVAGLFAGSAGVGRMGGGTRLPPLGGRLFPVTATHPILQAAILQAACSTLKSEHQYRDRVLGGSAVASPRFDSRRHQ